jgi:hypothetical protein
MRHGVGGGNEPSLINYLDALNCGRAAASDAAPVVAGYANGCVGGDCREHQQRRMGRR